jgi:hypothetical protein
MEDPAGPAWLWSVQAKLDPGPWQRRWKFLIWSWTLTTWDKDDFVLAVQQRFVGVKIVRSYNKAVWMVIAWSVILGSIVAISLLSLFAYFLVRHWTLEPTHWVILCGALVLLALAPTAMAYFTFVPPKPVRDLRKSSRPE